VYNRAPLSTNAKGFSLPLNIQCDFGALPDSCFTVFGYCIPEVECTADYSPPSISKNKNEWSYTYSSLHAFMGCRRACTDENPFS